MRHVGTPPGLLTYPTSQKVDINKTLDFARTYLKLYVSNPSLIFIQDAPWLQNVQGKLLLTFLSFFPLLVVQFQYWTPQVMEVSHLLFI